MNLRRTLIWIGLPIILVILTLIGLHGYKFYVFITSFFDAAMLDRSASPLKEMVRQILASLEAWQTLITGIFALCAAAMGVLAVIYQTSETKKLSEEARLERAHALRRAILPFLLSKITGLCQSEAKAINDALGWVKGEGTFYVTRTKQALTNQNVEKFLFPHMLDIIELHNGEFQKNLSVLCNKLQIYQARVQQLKEPEFMLLRSSLLWLALDVSEIKARADKFFPIARSSLIDAPKNLKNSISPADLKEAAFFLFPQIYGELEGLIDKHVQTGELIDQAWSEA